MQSPDVSIIVPIYNSEATFEKCLRSLFGQTLYNLEYIFINDCTPDDSMRILFRVLEDYPHRKNQINVIDHKINLGPGISRKEGMEAAQGNYVIHCDSDDWVDSKMYEEMFKTALETDADLVCCGFYREFLGFRQKELYPPYFEDIPSMINKLSWRVLYSALWNKLVKRNLYVKHEVYPVGQINMWEDLSIMTRLRFFSKKTVIINEAFYHYNQQNSSSFSVNSTLSKVSDQIYCADFLDDFFKKQNVYQDFFLFVQSIKFSSKERLLVSSEIRDINRWKNTFTDTHQYIFDYIDLPLNMRIIYWIASNISPYFACFILDIKKKLKELL